MYLYTTLTCCLRSKSEIIMESVLSKVTKLTTTSERPWKLSASSFCNINASIDNKNRKSRKSGSDNFILHNDKSWPKSGTFIKIYAVHLICISKAVPWREKKRVQLYDINHLFKVKEVTLRKSITDFTSDKQLCAAFMASLLAYIGHIGSLDLFFL